MKTPEHVEKFLDILKEKTGKQWVWHSTYIDPCIGSVMHRIIGIYHYHYHFEGIEERYFAISDDVIYSEGAALDAIIYEMDKEITEHAKEAGTMRGDYDETSKEETDQSGEKEST